jgi:hypothetical protein
MYGSVVDCIRSIDYIVTVRQIVESSLMGVVRVMDVLSCQDLCRSSWLMSDVRMLY